MSEPIWKKVEQSNDDQAFFLGPGILTLLPLWHLSWQRLQFAIACAHLKEKYDFGGSSVRGKSSITLDMLLIPLRKSTRLAYWVLQEEVYTLAR